MGPGAASGDSANDDHPPDPHENGGIGDADDEVAQLEVDGWAIGFDVEMNGVGHVVAAPDDDSDADSDSDDSTAEDPAHAASSPGHADHPYAGYQLLGDSSDGILHETHLAAAGPVDSAPSPSSYLREQCNETLNAAPGVHLKEEDFPIPHRPVSIDLDPEKVDEIRGVMTGIRLPAESVPPWAREMSDAALAKLLEAVKTGKSPSPSL